MANERLAPDAILAQVELSGAVTDIDDDPDSSDGLWLTASTSGATSCRVSFPTPTDDLTTGAGLQEFRHRVRKNASGGNQINFDVELWENGAFVSTLASNFALDSATGVTFGHTWNASALAAVSGVNVEFRIVQTNGASGNPSNRRYLEVGAVEWNAEYTVGATVITVGLATETDSVLQKTIVKGVGLATETDTAFSVGIPQTIEVGLTTETDSAFAVRYIFNDLEKLLPAETLFEPAGQITSYSAGIRGGNIVFACNTSFGSSPADGVLSEFGANAQGSYIGLRDSGATLRVRAGDGISASAPGVGLALLDVTDFPADTAKHTVVWEYKPGAPGRVRLWIDDEFKGKAETSDAGALEATLWAGADNGGYTVANVTGGPTDEPVTAWGGSVNGTMRVYQGELVPGIWEIVGQATETDTAFAVMIPKIQLVGLATETDSAFNSTALRVVSVGQATETDEAFPVEVAGQTVIVGLATETDTSFAVTVRHTLAVGLATETDTSLTATIARTVEVGLSEETDSAFASTHSKKVVAALSTETDEAFTVTSRKVYDLGLTTETDLAQAATVNRSIIVTLASVTDSTFSVTWSKTGQVGLVTETDTSFSVTASSGLGAGLASESDSAFAVLSLKQLEVGLALETDSGLAATVRRALNAGLTTETDSAFSVSNPKLVVADLIEEFNEAFAVTFTQIFSEWVPNNPVEGTWTPESAAAGTWVKEDERRDQVWTPETAL